MARVRYPDGREGGGSRDPNDRRSSKSKKGACGKKRVI